jgi:hypothetical protein
MWDGNEAGAEPCTWNNQVPPRLVSQRPRGSALAPREPRQPFGENAKQCKKEMQAAPPPEVRVAETGRA